jgi:hypothetical protein
MANITEKINKERFRNYLAKDFKTLRGSLTDYVELYYGDKISDFSESGLAGMFLDMAAYVGDSMSYYLDFQFNEMDLETAVDIKNIQKHLKVAGVKPKGPTPSQAVMTISLIIPSVLTTTNEYAPNKDYLPVLRSGTIITSDTGIDFELIEDLDFNEVDDLGNYTYSFSINSNDLGASGNPGSFIVEKDVIMISGSTIEEEIDIDQNFVPFRAILLSNSGINEILSVEDSNGNKYYEVDNLTQDVVFKSRINLSSDSSSTKDVLEIVPAPRRFIVESDIQSGLSTLVFGSGDENDFQDILMPPPESIALNLFGKRTFTNYSIDTNNLLKTDTLGISPRDTTLKIKYRAGGGINHNVPAGSIQNISSFTLDFNSEIPVSVRTQIRNSISAINKSRSSGGENELSIDELRFIGINSRSLQSRIVSKEDLIARIYSMPSSLGRVFRAAAISNLSNPFSASLFIVSRNAEGDLVRSSDTMKKNIKTFINQFRLVSDSIDILDAPVANFGIEYSIVVEKSKNKNSVIQTANSKLSEFFNIENFQIGTPILKTDISRLLLTIPGIVSIIPGSIKIKNLSGTNQGNVYSDFIYPIAENDRNGIVYPPEGGIFEMKYPQFDIKGKAY